MEYVRTDHAPAAVGAYSQAVKTAGFVFTAGQIGIDPASGKLVEGGVVAQAERVMQNLAAVLEAAGSSLSRVVKTTVFVADIADVQEVNGAYAAAFGDHRPARSLVQAGALPLGARVEIDAVARLAAS
jgi:2-iminobutanoate/2-iminopropanoate deaminase